MSPSLSIGRTMNLSHGLLLICVATTWYMVGLIWLIQVVHYPLFELIPPDAFLTYHAAHLRRISVVVILPMLLELLTSLMLALLPPAGVPHWVAWLGAGLVLVVWGLTFALQTPQHGLLAQGYAADTIRALVEGNWWRTFAWTMHGVVGLAMLVMVWEQR